MERIVLTEEQARVIAGATGSVEVHDPQGRVLAFLKPLDPKLAETIRECQRRLAAPGPRIPAAKVEAFLRTLDEIDQREGITPAQVEEHLRQLLGGNAG
jgi:hypothetical protein